MPAACRYLFWALLAASPPGQGQLAALSLDYNIIDNINVIASFVVIIVCCQCFCYALSGICVLLLMLSKLL